MKLGEQVRHRDRPEMGVGRITHLENGGGCDAEFATGTFSGIPSFALISVEADVMLDKLNALLAAGEFEEARSLYGERGKEYLSPPAFDQLLRRSEALWQRRLTEIEALRVEQERSDRRAEIEGSLETGNFDQADALYRTYCRTWWDEAEYQCARGQSVAIHGLMQAYPSTSLAQLDATFAKDFASWFSADDFARVKLPKLRIRLARLGLPLDEEQLLACARPERHRLIRARAGSGKTRTLAALAALSIHDEALNPDQVLILAFNKKAAQEIGGRVRSAAGIAEYRNARTFHSLAWQLADHAGRDLIFDDGQLTPSRRKQTGFVERLIGSIMNPAFREDLYEFFRHELEQLDRLGSNLSREDYLTFRRSMVDYTLGGETVKSNGEKFIADFLFEHGIAYKYEQVHSWDRQDRLNGTPYRPDFSIIEGGRDIILEHWAINPDESSAQVPDWWETSTQSYRDQIEAKREFWAARGVTLLETHAGMLADGRQSFEAALRNILERARVHCRKLEHDLLVRRVTEAPRNVSKMAELFMQFISRAKKRGWSVEVTAKTLQDAPDPEPRNRIFHQLAVHAYGAYESGLAEQSAMDFDDLLNSAAECVRRQGGAMHLPVDRTHSIAIRDLRWILIDEFQDFSELYFRLIAAILEANPSIRLVAVGDDWQAINGFAGAQLTFFNRFSNYFGKAGRATISTNRRSGCAIVAAGNQIMAGQGVPALAHRRVQGDIETVYVDKVWLEDASIYTKAATMVRDDGGQSTNWDLAKALKACADGISKSVAENSTHQGLRQMPSVLVLARTGRAYNITLAEFGRRLASVLREHPDLQDLTHALEADRETPAEPREDAMPIQVMTAHGSKGKEADTVIVLEAVARQFPKVHADNQLFGLFGISGEDVLAEERRLFYVALTRAAHRLILLSETSGESPYLKPLANVSRASQWAPGPRTSAREAWTSAICDRLDALDSNEMIQSNISDEAISAWKRLRAGNLGSPEVGYCLQDRLHAELAWPEAKPPVAIVVGHHKAKATEWEAQGWQVRFDTRI